MLGFLWHLRPPPPAFFRFLCGFCGTYTVFLASLAFVFGLAGNMLAFDAKALLAGVYLFLTAKAHSRVNQQQRRPRPY